MLGRLLFVLSILPLPHAGAGAADRPALRFTVVEGIEFVTDHDVPRDRLQALAADVTDVQQRLADELGLPPVEATPRFYLFDDRRTFSWYVQQMIPSLHWSQTFGRHGIFLQREGRPHVFLLTGDELESTVRHETVHMVVNAAIPNAPVWLDEGLAQCYSTTDGSYDDPRAAAVLRKDVFRRNPPTAAQVSQNTTMGDMSARDYAGAWHHVRRLLQDDAGRAALRETLAALHAGEMGPDLVERLDR